MFLSAHAKNHRLLARCARVYLDGKDVTKDCYAASEKRGVALFYVRKDGYLHVKNNRIEREMKCGKVVIEINLPEGLLQGESKLYELQQKGYGLNEQAS